MNRHGIGTCNIGAFAITRRHEEAIGLRASRRTEGMAREE